MTQSDGERISLYLDNQFTAEERAKFERDVEARPELKEQLDRWRDNDGRLRSALDLPLPADLVARLGLAPDNLVDLADLGALALHWNEQGTATWADGDFTDDGSVDVADLYQLALRWDSAPGSPSFAEALAAFDLPPATVPEPGTIAIIGLSALLALGRRDTSPATRRARGD